MKPTKKPVRAIWSVGAFVGGRSVNVRQSELALSGGAVIRQRADGFFGSGSEYLSRPLHNPTWRQLLGCATTAINKTGDFHHVFFEGVQASTDVHVLKDGRTVPIYDLMMGS